MSIHINFFAYYYFYPHQYNNSNYSLSINNLLFADIQANLSSIPSSNLSDIQNYSKNSSFPLTLSFNYS